MKVNELEEKIRFFIESAEVTSQQVEEFAFYALGVSQCNGVQEVLTQTLHLMVHSFGFEEGRVNFVGEFETFNLSLSKNKYSVSNAWGMNIRHGKLRLIPDIVFIDQNSDSRERSYLKEVLAITPHDGHSYLVMTFYSGGNNRASLVLKKKAGKNLKIYEEIYRLSLAEFKQKLWQQKVEEEAVFSLWH